MMVGFEVPAHKDYTHLIVYYKDPGGESQQETIRIEDGQVSIDLEPQSKIIRYAWGWGSK